MCPHHKAILDAGGLAAHGPLTEVHPVPGDTQCSLVVTLAVRMNTQLLPCLHAVAPGAAAGWQVSFEAFHAFVQSRESGLRQAFDAFDIGEGLVMGTADRL